MLMSSDHGAVEDEPLQVGVLHHLEDPIPDFLGGPAIEPLPDRIPVPKAFGKVSPGCPGLGDPENSIDEETIVRGGHTGVAILAGEEIFDAFPVFIRYSMATHGWMLEGGEIEKLLTLLT
jgi:hypothetical protein